MTATRVRLSPETRRQQIIDAARDLYAQRTYEEVSLQDLADAAGVARGLISHYFGEKREVFLAVMRDSVVLPVQPIPAFQGDLAERARTSMDWILQGAATYGQAWVNASGAADLPGGTDMQSIIDAADDRAARLVLDTLGLEDAPHLRIRLRVFSAMVKSTCREWLQHGNLTQDEALDLLTDTLVHLVQLDPEAAHT